VILEGARDGHVPEPLSITLVRLPYDIERAIQDAAEGMPDAQPYAVELRTARYQRGTPGTPE
jgi:protein phosphatase